MSLQRFAIASLLAATACGAGYLGCSDDTPQVAGAKDTGTTGGSVQSWPAPACGYNVQLTVTDQTGAVQGIDPHAPGKGADPTPKNVRRGLGGNVHAGKPAYADPSTSLLVGWQTDTDTLASQIQYGESPDKLDKTVDGFSWIVPQDGAISAEMRMHEAHVCGLSPGRTYYWKVGTDGAWSDVKSSTTAPAKGSKDKVQIGFVGDSRDAVGRPEYPIWTAIAKRYKSAGVPLVLFSGDMVFNGITQNLWDAWIKATGDTGTSAFIALAPGNHENETLRSFAHLLMPRAETNNALRYASFDYGPVHVVMFDDYRGIVAKSIDDTGYRDEVLAWLDEDLKAASANRANVPWIVTFHHHPVYSDTSQIERDAEKTQVRAAILGLYDKYKVDLDLTGHDHLYQRFKPQAGGAESASGTTYVVAAAAGAPHYDFRSTLSPTSAFNKTYDETVQQGYYGIASVDGASFHVTMYDMPSAGAGMSPSDDKLLEEFDVAKK
ncbi:MAG: purple acid phosphatase family protein [Polyangiales bacterium]